MRGGRPAAVVLCLLAVALQGCGGGGDADEASGRSSDRGDARVGIDEDPTRLGPSQLERFARIELPDSARRLDAVLRQAFQGESLTAKFVIDRSDLGEFIRGARFRDQPEEGLRYVTGDGGLGPEVDDVQRFLGTSDVIPGVGRNVLIDLDRPGIAVVYLVASSK